jgi:hypothetical protein
MPVLTYGAETWTGTKAEIRRLMRLFHEYKRKNQNVENLKINTLEDSLTNNNKMLWTHFKNEQMENPKGLNMTAE